MHIYRTEINETLEPVNNVLGEFETFSSNLFSQIMGWITPMLQSLLEYQIF